MKKQLFFRFRSNAYGQHPGFQMHYRVLHSFTNCGGRSSNSSGIIVSPSHPMSYPPMANCIYVVSQPTGKLINISIANMDIACQKTGYTSDYIEFRDGGNENSQMMGRFCGNSTNIPSLMQTSQNFLWVRWEMFVNSQ